MPSKDDLLRARSLAEVLATKDPFISPYASVIARRIAKVSELKRKLTGGSGSLADFASGHEYYGLHRNAEGWVFREWAPAATAVYLVGEFSGWKERPEFMLSRINAKGDFEIRLWPEALHHGDLYRLRVFWEGGSGDRIPAYARRVVQDPGTHIMNAQVWKPEKPYVFRNPAPAHPPAPFFIYEAHVGMAQQEERVGTYTEFAEKIIPRIADSGYNAIQLMAIAEHPYYASFGYQVGSFFAASSRFGTPEELKALVDEAHGRGLTVLMDLVHSHAVGNEVEGLARFDGTEFQYFHKGPRGRHEGWDSRLFDYAKPEVLHFLLSNCRFFLDEYRIDGFRMDGITSMIYLHHGLSMDFVGYEEYFSDRVDEDALSYLALANEVIHEVRPGAITIAEDVSGMPGLAMPAAEGGFGFDFRFSMGLADFWIKLIKDFRDEDWPMGKLWYELTTRRHEEKTVSYAECHDQALVGDQTLIFRLVGTEMYRHMSVLLERTLRVSRGIALHKIVRLATAACAGHGYLNFMGNEFGHPEWIDFPREGNHWSYRYARRQWSLADDPLLLYRHLLAFDRAMLKLLSVRGIPDGSWPYLLLENEQDKILCFLRRDLMFCFNFHPDRSFSDYRVPAPPGRYRMVLDTDDPAFGGQGLLDRGVVHEGMTDEIHRHYVNLYLPARTAFVLEKT
ncbi:MAG: alpha amylase C-terminal domain-containing protein [Thermodesulfobacteriota bacterium]